MSVRRRILGVAAGAAGVAVAGTAVGVARHRRVIAHRGAGDATPFGSLRSRPITVVADDGVPLHVEVDESPAARRATAAVARRGAAQPPLTVVFCHGYALNLDCWHFQRAGYRGLVRVGLLRPALARPLRPLAPWATRPSTSSAATSSRSSTRSCPRGRSCSSATRWAA